MRKYTIKQPIRLPVPKPATPEEIAKSVALQAGNIVRSGRARDWVWYIEFKVTIADYVSYTDTGLRLAIYPWDMVPIIPLDKDPEGAYAYTLAELFRSGDKKKRAEYWYPRLWKRADLPILCKPNVWYEWGSIIVDIICPNCGQVSTIDYGAAIEPCECGYTTGAHSRRLEPLEPSYRAPNPDYYYNATTINRLAAHAVYADQDYLKQYQKELEQWRSLLG